MADGGLYSLLFSPISMLELELRLVIMAGGGLEPAKNKSPLRN